MPIFETRCVEQLIQYKWERFAQRSFLIQLVLHLGQTFAYNYLSVLMGCTSEPLLHDLDPRVKVVR
eukprot:COSAG01_NODE_18515_length_1071_cov_1.031893_2_plen_66_part_00